MNENLPKFIKFLEDHGLVEFEILDNSDTHLANRIKLQKYAFFAKRFGMPFNYDHTMYLYGPYCSELTGEYYEIAHDKKKYYVDGKLPPEFKSDDFVAAMKNDSDWLEVAATIVEMSDRIEPDELMEAAYRVKERFGKEFIDKVRADLESRRLMGTPATYQES